MAGLLGFFWIFRVAFLFLGLASILVAQAQTAPHLVSVTPADGATQVPATSSLVFVFDQDMDTTIPFFPSIPGVIVGNFDFVSPGFNGQLSGTWTDERTLTADPDSQFSNGTYSWTLNPAGVISFVEIKSAAGVALATISREFHGWCRRYGAGFGICRSCQWSRLCGG